MSVKAGCTPLEFWNLSWWEFDCIAAAHNEKEEGEWKRVREIITMVYNVNVTKKSHIKQSKEIMPLPSDIKNIRVISPEEKEAMYIRMVELHTNYIQKYGNGSRTIS